ncbi:hypothetical protein ACS74_01220 [Exiguobacterium acetylicum]|nr:hypothetical protein ACS74_01220 [Exiguobacterium acetylicum]
MGTTNVAVILAFHRRKVSRGILNYVSSTGSHLTLTQAKNMLSFPVGVENEQLRSTSSINDTFSGSCPENVSFFYVVHLIFTTPFFYHSNLVCKGKINNVKPVFGIS